jgi:Cdc6-like AAA superfamily ATPase
MPNQELALRAGRVFSPGTPIRERDVFAGRTQQLRRVVDAINQEGQHVLIYGERGVGKTSLANVLAGFVRSSGQPEVIAPHVNCDTNDDFSTVWRKILKNVTVAETHRPMGLNAPTETVYSSLGERVEEEITPDTVLSVARMFTGERVFIPIIDEFDRLTHEGAAPAFTDTIKALSDQSPYTTVVLVGIADTVEQLMAEHQSVERALVQVRMPRMSMEELLEIVANGVGALGMTVEEPASRYIAKLSQGLPYYTHLLGLYATRDAIDADETEVRLQNVDAAICAAIEGVQQTLEHAYHRATMSHRSDALYTQVLLACALAETDQLGYFAAVDVREPMSHIMGRRYEIPAFLRHLADFCREDRGPVLERIGVPRRYRFRFRNPLLQPFVIMRGLAAELISRTELSESGVTQREGG